MYKLLGYNKYRDVYDLIGKGDKQVLIEHAKNLLSNGSAVDDFGEPYDWLEIVYDADGCGEVI